MKKMNIYWAMFTILNLDTDPPVGCIIDPVGRIKISHDKGVRLVFIFNGMRESTTSKYNKAAFVIGSGFAQRNRRGFYF